MGMGKWVERIAKGAADTTKNATKSTLRETADALDMADKVIGGAANVAAYLPAKATEYTAKGLKHGLTRKATPNITNFYTGIEMRTGSGLALGAGAMGYGYMSYAVGTTAPKPGTVNYGGSAPIFDADGVSNTTNAPTLNANGNMVFGMHRGRKG